MRTLSLPGIFVLSVLAVTATAQASGACGKPSSIERGGDLFVAMEASRKIAGLLAAAEKICDAKGLDWDRTFERLAAKEGCSADSPVGWRMVISATVVRDTTLEQLIFGGPLLERPADEIARAGDRLERHLGGCPKLRDLYGTIAKRDAERTEK